MSKEAEKIMVDCIEYMELKHHLILAFAEGMETYEKIRNAKVWITKDNKKIQSKKTIYQTVTEHESDCMELHSRRFYIVDSETGLAIKRYCMRKDIKEEAGLL